MLDGICPKCGSERVYAREAQGYDGYVAVGPFQLRHFRIIYYLCLTCKYMETYAPEDVPEDDIERFWYPVTKPKRG